MDTTGFFGVRTFPPTHFVLQGIILLSILGPAVLQSCSGTQNVLENGTVSSPGHPTYNYRSYCQLYWIITVPEGYVAILTFHEFTIESCSNCGCDYVIVYDGPDANSPQLAKLCGSNKPAAIYASQNRMFVKFGSDGSVAYSGFRATVSKGEIFSQNIESDNGTIQSPNYPNDYDPMTRYVWNITVPEDHQIFLEFLSFELQYSSGCVSDFVEVRDGHDPTSPLLGKMCGTNVEKIMRSSENKMTISFQSDGSQEARGFFSEFRKVGKCGATIEGTSGNFNTPNYPNNYGPAERCVWNIVAPEDHHVLVRFLTFNIADSSDCPKDFVQIYNGNDTSAKSLGRFCGSDAPNATKSTSNQVTVVFHSDAAVEAKGFSARFETDLCGREFHSESGTFHSPNYPNAYQNHEMCSWKVTVAEGYRVALRFDSFKLEGSYGCNADSVRVFDGLSADSPVLDKLCGERTYRAKAYSSGNTLSVRFTTDQSYAKSGFSASFIKVPIPVSSGNTSGTSNPPCQQEIKTDTGTVTSPRYPEWYSPDIDCTWNIEVSSGSLIRLEFQSFDVEENEGCSFDYLEIRDGDSSGRSLGTYCTTKAPEPVWSSSNKIALRFVTDSSFEHPGFSATFSKVDYMESNLTADSETVMSPNYPNNYGPVQMRVWNLSVPPGNKIFLRFLNFELEYSQNCTDDFVVVRDGHDPSSTPLGKFCGTETPVDIRSSSNKLTIIFATDTSEELSGFSAKFEAEAECGDYTCRNGGMCQGYTRRLYRCSCKHGFQGTLCEETILCSNNTCENGGLCFQNGTDGVFQCICSHGYEGAVCHERILCGNKTCKNGGFCTHAGKEGIFLCVCEPGFEGLWCEKSTPAKSAGTVVSIVVPVVILLVIASAAILFLLIRRRLKQQPYNDMKQAETFFEKDEMSDS